LTEHLDALETRSAGEREAALAAALPRVVAWAKAAAPHYARALEGVDPEAVAGPAALARLPVTRKSALVAQQATDPPFGGVVATTPDRLLRVFASPGPL
jgi:phenylacetate-CoA ligase